MSDYSRIPTSFEALGNAGMMAGRAMCCRMCR